MTPLSWNVYGNHVENCRLLLEHGAQVNADFDYTSSQTGKLTVTVLDIVHMISRGAKDEFEEMEELLLKYGAKTFKELSR